MPTLAFTVVQLAAALLSLAATGTKLPAATREAVRAVADQAVATAVWTLSEPDAATTAVDIDANAEKLHAAKYLSDVGAYVSLGAKAPITGSVMTLVEEYTSFGHLDDDGLADAAPIVKTVHADGRVTYHIAIMRNFGGTLVNTLRQPLPELEAVYDHRIADKGLRLDYKPKGGERTTTFYTVHTQFKEAPMYIITRNPEPLPVAERNTTDNKLASFIVFAAPWSGGVKISSVTVNKDYDHGIRLANLRVAGSATPARAVIRDAESELTFATDVSVPAGEMRTIDVYADITGGDPGVHASVIDLIRAEASGMNSGTFPWLAPQDGQNVTLR